ncbi:dTMP kinase [Acinetobacter johnsonii]|jgi:thymidylate kinase|uniref:dTMP kinase n=1 Tax=Acinetobacter johnsonii TaxID=40214 RepID=UPI002446A8A9|nr:deoxynucleoside kinase [Acinetobacter johnsonii]MDH1712731.1 AAA family ATPase [Acinetobacter johnsonii]MDQ8975258.1 AAA family ATPase [Acinetobacter johnsonii]
MYIALEGTKGTGKSTIFSQLEIALQYDGIQFATFSPTKPMPTDLWWEKAYAQYSEVDQFIEELYHARANHHAKKISFDEPLVLGDRSILTSFVTRWPQESQKLHEYIQHTRAQEYAVPVPDMVIYLDLPIEVTLQRLANRERNYGLRDEQIERLIQAKMAYEEFFKFKNELGFTALKYQYVDANQNETELFSQVYNLVKNELEKSMNFQ